MLDIVPTLPKFQNDIIARLARVWLEKLEGTVIPDRRQMDPLEFPWALRHFWVYELEPTSERFRCRLAGEDVRVRYKQGIVGRYLDEFIEPGILVSVTDQYRQVIDLPGLAHSIGRVYLKSINLPGLGERVFFPVRDTEMNRTLIYGATVYQSILEDGSTRPSTLIRRTVTPISEIAKN